MISIEKYESSWCPIEKRFIWSASARDLFGRLHLVEVHSERVAISHLEMSLEAAVTRWRFWHD